MVAAENESPENGRTPLRPAVVLKGLVTVLVAPRETVRTFLDAPDDRLSFALVLLGTIATTLLRNDHASRFGFVRSLPAPLSALLVFVAVLVMAAVTAVLFYLSSHLGAWIGRALGGRANAREVRVAIAWGSVPMIWSLLFVVPARVLIFAIGAQNALRAAILGHHHPGDFLATRTVAVMIIGLVVALLFLAVLVWTLVVTSQCLGEAHRFSSVLGFVTLVASVAIPLFVVIGSIVGFVTMVSML